LQGRQTAKPATGDKNMTTQTIIKGSYATQIRERNDLSGFDLTMLYNVENEMFSQSDVWDRKTYKTKKMAERKANEYFAAQGVI